jgi:transcriptional regulator with PAS, ATPase and Fis domain
VSPLTDSGGGVQGALAIFTCLTEPPVPQRQVIVVESREMRQVLSLARRVAASEAETILLEGESGTGKELVARLLHDDSYRRAQPFVAINCAAMPEALLESELFGYERGAFTDARGSKRGLLELADKGTLFLDEIGELPLAIQAKFLRVLDDRSFRRLGGLQDIQSDIRIVAATNRDLLRAVTEGSFRGDLYYRVNVIALTMPPLRERRDDILPLARFFLEHFRRKFKRRPQELPAETARLLIAYDWPGNVRELRNLIERSVLLQDTDSIPADSLPFYALNRAIPIDRPVPVASHVSMSLRENEQLLIANAMTRADGNQSEAARLLGIGRDALRYRLKNGERVPRRFVKLRVPVQL